MTKTTQPFDWAPCLEAVTDTKIQELVSARGYSIDLVRRLRDLKMIGVINGEWAFPVHSADGTIVGAHIRKESGWRYLPSGGTARLLVLGDVSKASEVWIFESQWDAFSAMDAALCSARLDDIAIVVTRGAGNGSLLDGMIPRGRPTLAFPQNDEIKPDGSSPAINWLHAVQKAAGTPVSAVRTPPEFKDLNEWFKSVEVGSHFWKAVARAAPPGIHGVKLGDLKRSIGDDPKELLKKRYLCRGGGLLMIGATELGKSSFAMQCMVLWALGRDAFGITPARPLRSFLVQAENDDADLAEMRDGVFSGLGLSEEERKTAESRISVFRENSLSGEALCQQVIRPLLMCHRPDLLWIDPALAYLGGEAASQKDVGEFLRLRINPLINEFDCGVVIVHHTNKPPSESRPGGGLPAEEMAYAGSGSAEWANWARAVLVLRRVKGKSYFQLCAGKRGGRIGWYESDNATRRFSRCIAHGKEPEVICWREVGESEISPSEPKMVVRKTQDDLLGLVPLDTTISKNSLLEKASVQGIADKKARLWIELLLESNKLHVHKVRRSRTNPKIHLARFPQQSLGL